MKRKFFTEKQVDISAVLAGPIPPGILIYHNFKTLGREKQAYISLATTLIFTIAFFYGLMQLPRELVDDIPNFVFTAFYGLLIMVLYRSLMAKDVNQALEGGAEKASNWSVAGLTLLGLSCNFLIVWALVLDQPAYDGKVLEVNGNELYYEESIPLEDVNQLANKFKSVGFFGSDFANVARLEEISGEYYITVLADEQFWSDQDFIQTLTSMKWLLEVDFNRPVQLKLESVSLAGVSRFKNIE